MNSTQSLVLRSATDSDVPLLVAMNHAAYPDLVEANVVWNSSQLESHIHLFRDGQIVATRENRLVGAVSTFIVDPEIDPSAQHTWIEITRDGTFANHNEAGDTLYLADVYVHPNAWGSGVAVALYDALKNLCRARNLKRVIAGGRLWGYFEYANLMTPEKYATQVISGILHDRVLSSQLRAGFMVTGILANYLRDERSCHYASLLEWTNPDYRKP